MPKESVWITTVLFLNGYYVTEVLHDARSVSHSGGFIMFSIIFFTPLWMEPPGFPHLSRKVHNYDSGGIITKSTLSTESFLIIANLWTIHSEPLFNSNLQLPCYAHIPTPFLIIILILYCLFYWCLHFQACSVCVLIIKFIIN